MDLQQRLDQRSETSTWTNVDTLYNLIALNFYVGAWLDWNLAFLRTDPFAHPPLFFGTPARNNFHASFPSRGDFSHEKGHMTGKWDETVHSDAGGSSD